MPAAWTVARDLNLLGVNTGAPDYQYYSLCHFHHFEDLQILFGKKSK
jgi:hypothetical protein